MGKKRFVTALAAVALAGAGFTTTACAEETQPSLFEQIAGDYTFTPGIGGWDISLSLASDGSFTAENYNQVAYKPDGSGGFEVQICEYTGQLSNPQEVAEGVYSASVKRSACDTSKGEQYEENGNSYTVSDDSSDLRDGDTLKIYAPGTPIADVAPKYKEWASIALAWPGASSEAPSAMPFVGLYSQTNQLGFWPDNDSATPGGYVYVDTSDSDDKEDPAGGDSGVVAGFAGDTRLADLSDAEVAGVFDARLVAQGELIQRDVPGVRIWFEDENGKFVAGMKPGDVMDDEAWDEIRKVRVKGGWHVRITSDVLPANFEAVDPVKAARGEKLNVDYVVPCGEELVSIFASANPWKSGHGVTAVHMFDFDALDNHLYPTDAAVAAYVRDRYETVADVPLFALNQGTGGNYVPTYVDGCVVKAQTPEAENASNVQSEKLPDTGANVGVLAGVVVTALLAGAGLLAVRRYYARV